jgi:hypothetical protein
MTGSEGQDLIVPDDGKEDLAPGHAAERDSETGRFLGTDLSSDRARETGQRGGRAGLRIIRAESAELADALVEAASGGPESWVRARELLLRSLAVSITKGGAGSVAAAQAVAGALGRPFDAVKPPGAGEPCPLCGREEAYVLQITSPVARRMGQLMAGTNLGEKLLDAAERVEAKAPQGNGSEEG